MKKYLIVIFIFLIGCSQSVVRHNPPITKHSAKITIVLMNTSVSKVSEIETRLRKALGELYKNKNYYEVYIEIERLKVGK